jgi:MFS family permease
VRPVWLSQWSFVNGEFFSNRTWEGLLFQTFLSLFDLQSLLAVDNQLRQRPALGVGFAECARSLSGCVNTWPPRRGIALPHIRNVTSSSLPGVSFHENPRSFAEGSLKPGEMAQAAAQVETNVTAGHGIRMAAVAWVLTAVYYFYQYALRSAPGVMMPQLSEAFGLSALGVASIVGLFYYGYSPFSLVAGAAMDRLGPRRLLPYAAVSVGIGALLFATGQRELASVGRFIQGAGGVFALVGAIYIATKNFAPSKAATLIGATQMFGMAGGSAGQFVVGPMIAGGMNWTNFWIGMGVAGLIIGVVLFFLIPKEESKATANGGLKSIADGFRIVFKNPQSILCGLIAGLLFIPTTILDMTWGVRFLQEGHGFNYATAVLRSSTVPFGWIIGCPLLGFISDRIGRRKPVIIVAAIVLLGCLVLALYGSAGTFPPYTIGLVAGIASGAAMLPYTIIKEANPPHLGGTATGVVNFINFTFSALLGPVFGWILVRVSGGAAEFSLEHFQTTFTPLLYGVAVAIVLTLILKETGPAVRNAATKAG